MSMAPALRGSGSGRPSEPARQAPRPRSGWRPRRRTARSAGAGRRRPPRGRRRPRRPPDAGGRLARPRSRGCRPPAPWPVPRHRRVGASRGTTSRTSTTVSPLGRARVSGSPETRPRRWTSLSGSVVVGGGGRGGCGHDAASWLVVAWRGRSRRPWQPTYGHGRLAAHAVDEEALWTARRRGGATAPRERRRTPVDLGCLGARHRHADVRLRRHHQRLRDPHRPPVPRRDRHGTVCRDRAGCLGRTGDRAGRPGDDRGHPHPPRPRRWGR